MFHVKICGIKLPVDVASVKGCGGDAVGLNFYEPSARYVDPTSPQTKRLSELAGEAGLKRVGVFVDADPESIAQVAAHVGLDAVQLHGDESLETAQAVRERSGLPVIRAIKLPTDSLAPDLIATKAEPWIESGFHLLLDVDGGAAQGGTGQPLDWESVAVWASQHPDLQWTLAGGLNPENVGDAIEICEVTSVDTASGVEETRGVKSEWLIRRFVVEARAALGV